MCPYILERMTRVAINGFGRIGRTVARLILDQPELELVAVNDLHDASTMAHLFKYDTVHGVLKKGVTVVDHVIHVEGDSFSSLKHASIDDLPWSELEIDFVVECTGLFKSREDLQRHLTAGAKKVILSVPSSDSKVPMVVLGVNESIITPKDDIVSNASCTTHSAAHMIQLLDESCGIESCYITTVHSYTGDQRLQDAPHRDLRRARAAALSIIPTTTGAAKALTSVFPHLSDCLGGCGIRVPIPDGSLTDITCIVREPMTEAQLNDEFRKASETRYNGLLRYCDDPIVSVDVLGSPESCIFDSLLTSVIGKMVKIVGWYDNEAGYSHRVIDLINYWKTI